jgi:hypothetical protein
VSVPDWYDVWAMQHATAFGFGPEGAKTVLAWGAKFVHLFTPDDLHAATEYLTGREDVPKWAADHRGLIIGTVRHLRQKAADRPQPGGYADGVCIECRGPGVVIVPHPGLDEYARWREVLLPPSADPDGERSCTRMAAVCCVLCEAGRRMRESSEQANRPLMTVTGYERKYPNCREVAAARAALAKADAAPPTAEDLERLDDMLAGARRRA